MKRVLLLLSIIVCMSSLVGCSASANKISVKDGAITVNGKVTALTTYEGWEATQTLSDGTTVKYQYCDSMEECPNNTSGVLLDDMTKYKNGRYFTRYHNTEVHAHFENGGAFIECYAEVELGGTAPEAIVQEMHNTVGKISLGETKSVDMDGKIFLNVTGFPYSARQDCILIPNVIKVSKETTDATEIFTFQEKTMTVKRGTSYDYYQYGEYLIQIVNTSTLDSYITLK